MLIDELKKYIYGKLSHKAKIGDSCVHNETSHVETDSDDHAQSYVIVVNDNSFHLSFATPGGVPVTSQLRQDETYQLIEISPVPTEDQIKSIIDILKERFPNVHIRMRNKYDPKS